MAANPSNPDDYATKRDLNALDHRLTAQLKVIHNEIEGLSSMVRAIFEHLRVPSPDPKAPPQ